MSITFAPATVGGPTVNMANGNAAQVIDLLGLTYDGDFGELAAEDFLGRVLLAQALSDVTFDDVNGRPAVREGNWIDCGRRPDYLVERLAELQKIATWAHERNAVVVWS
jgi:hypothetical protein